jgi:hypothetical protein
MTAVSTAIDASSSALMSERPAASSAALKATRTVEVLVMPSQPLSRPRALPPHGTLREEAYSEAGRSIIGRARVLVVWGGSRVAMAPRAPWSP